ncbi:MAG TPA: SMC family ATPase [Streptosporangiaceae bacterium]
MRPLRLYLDGFGSYREPAEADFTGVDFFALVGPTGSGKSTVIDGLCFALYGTVPRWGKENMISQALAPAANACRVALVFEAAGRRYAAVRALTRDKRGVHTKEARLELLDPDVPAGAPLADLLAASTEALAEGPDQVKARVQDILGLTYEHFTQSVLLPQGRFSEFLHAKPAERQDLLVELLAFGVYAQVGEAARRRAELAADRLATAEAARAALADASPEALASAQARVAELETLAVAARAELAALAELTGEAEEAAARAASVHAETRLLAGVRTPADVAGLASRIRAADELLARRTEERDAAEAAEADAAAASERLPSAAETERISQAYAERRDLDSRLAAVEAVRGAAQAELARRTEEAASTQAGADQAAQALAAAEREHAAAALAGQLTVGSDCPVCLRRVTSLPRHPEPADLTTARSGVRTAQAAASAARTAQAEASKAAAVADRDVGDLTARVAAVAAILAGAPPEPEAEATLTAIAAASQALGQAQRAVRSARQALAAAQKERDGLAAGERRARAALAAARDSVVPLGAPAIADADLAAAWAALTGWATAELAERGAARATLDATAAGLRAQLTEAAAGLGRLLAGAGVTGVTEPAQCEAAIATHAERAAGRLAAVRAALARAAELDRQVAGYTEDGQVAAMLRRLLRANNFERWLCGEALDSLMAEASQTLLELSGGQYQLDRDERNELVVIDYADAGVTRPVHTLSGGETFQASLALALALSRQVIGLSAGMRDLNSMFLDEGFGTLDEDTLETVGSTLERLSADSDRMIGIITHVPALADRAPVRFVVGRTGTSSTLRREAVS